MKRHVLDWTDEGTRRFGEHGRDWEFVCPGCKGVQTAKDFVAQGEDPDSAMKKAYSQCVKRDATLAAGRAAPAPGDCDWAAWGLFRGPDIVIADNGVEVPVFTFAPCKHPAKKSCAICHERFCPNDGCDPNHREACRAAMKP